MAKKRIPYWEKLQDPRWQKRRLEILSDRDFTCDHCDATDKTLHVHHKTYKKNMDPWDYADWMMEVLCVDCHAEVTRIQDELGTEIAKMGSSDLEILLGYARALALHFDRDLGVMKIENGDQAIGASNYCCVSVYDIIEAAKNGDSLITYETLSVLFQKGKRRLRGEALSQ